MSNIRVRIPQDKHAQIWPFIQRAQGLPKHAWTPMDASASLSRRKQGPRRVGLCLFSGAGSPRPCDGISVPDYGFDRCAGHHEMVDLRLTKKARLGRGLEFRDSTYQLGPAL